MDVSEFRKLVAEGIPAELPEPRLFDTGVSHAPVRRDLLGPQEKRTALRNALRYFSPVFHKVLATEFASELKEYGRIYMYRFRPSYEIRARHLEEFPHRSRSAAAIMLMISNNLDPSVAQHPHELITYGGNGAVFQNWAQYRLVMKYLSEMTDEQTLVIYSGHPLGLFPSHTGAPRVVVTNGMVIPNYSSPAHLERFNAMGVSQYGQMTAGSYMYIGPQGIVHGTTITIMNAARQLASGVSPGRKLFVSSGLGGMSGAQPKAARIAGLIAVVAEINPAAAMKRHSQGWVDEVIEGTGNIIFRLKTAMHRDEGVSLAFLGNIVDLWEALADAEVFVDIGSDQTSLHNPWAGGYYPAGVSFEESNRLMAEEPARFRELVKASLRRQVEAINRHTARGTSFFDYGNAFLLEASRAGADILDETGKFRYPSYVQSIMGPLCFDFGFGPFRWVCCSNDPSDLAASDAIAASVIENMMITAPPEIKNQLSDNLHWIREAGRNNLVVGSQARILYADAAGRISLAKALNGAVREGIITAPVVIGRDHHDVSGTDSPFRETSDICDGSSFTADMSVQNVIGDSFRGATWVSLHNGGGVGWGEVINGGFGMLLDGSPDTDRKIEMMLHWDVHNGIARRSWAGNRGARLTLERAMQANPSLKATFPYQADMAVVDDALRIFG